MNQFKTAFLLATIILTLVATSCVPGGGTQQAQGWSGVTFHDGIIYVGSMDGKVLAVNPLARRDGVDFPAQGEWYLLTGVSSSKGFSCTSSSFPAGIYSTPTIDSDLIYVGTYNGKVLAVNPLARLQGLIFPTVY